MKMRNVTLASSWNKKSIVLYILYYLINLHFISSDAKAFTVLVLVDYYNPGASSKHSMSKKLI